MRPLTLHASALNDAEYDLYTSSFCDLIDSDDAPNDCISFNDALYEQLRVSVREARAWLRGRYNDLPVQQIDSILNAIAPANVHAGRLSAGQFFAVMRLVMHVRTGKEPDPSLVFVQGPLAEDDAIDIVAATDRGLVSRKRRRLSNGSTATDASQARLLHSKELDVQDRVIFAIYDFLWKKEENWDRIVDPVTEDVPDPAPSILIPDDPGLLEQVEAKFVDLTRIPGMENLKHLWLFPLRFLIREEYVIIDEYLTSSEKSLLLLGQPGIGKSLYLTYCLLRRLIAGKGTIFSLMSTRRYVFLPQGVYRINRQSIGTLIIPQGEDNDMLILFDVNFWQGLQDTEASWRWRTIVASSPSEHRFKGWEKYNMANVDRFVMRTWSWQEVYLCRRESIVQRSMDAWRQAFANFGGSVRRIFQQMDAHIEDDIDANVMSITTDQLRLLTANADIFFDAASHSIIKIDPRIRDGCVVRRSLEGTIISRFIGHKLTLKKKKELTIAFREEFPSLLINPGTASLAGILFEQMGHQYIFKKRTSSYSLTPLSKSSASTDLLVDLSHIRDPFYFEIFNSSSAFDPLFYYRPISATCPSVDSFALEIDAQQQVVGMVAFQFTISSSHPIHVKFFKEMWTLTNNLFSFVKFVFVVPKGGKFTQPQPIKLKSDCEVWTPRIQQYVLEIDVDAIWD